MAVDWSAVNSLPLRLFDEKVQDFLPPAMFGPDRTTRSIKVGSETVECTSVMADRARVWIDRTGRIVEVSYKDSPIACGWAKRRKFRESSRSRSR